ncbi:MFS transporter, DHA1 family, bicyclomycin/chloramphenicol resistance protein [Ensifer adhaerens]|nr:MFS transporter, DHA1 family, bicyclomycin/chloramphenicol resistance protein [Ensifer adhaerens]
MNVAPAETPVMAKTRPLMSERRTSLIGAFMTMVGSMSMSLYTPAMPALAHAFGVSAASAKMTLTFYFAGFAFAQLVTGPASDAIGRRKAAIVFMLVYMAGSLMAIYAPTIEWLMFARLIQGIGASVGTTVSRAIVRDQFTGEQSSRIMNMIGIVLAVGPGIAPTIGGLILEFSSWQAIFLVMAGMGLTGIGISILALKETTTPDPSRAAPGPLFISYRRLVMSAPVMSAALTIGFAVGALYMLATVLPFVLIDVAGLTPAQFGLGMMAQTGSYFFGSVLFRLLLPSISAERLVIPGIVLVLLGSLLAVLSLQFLPLSYLSVMVPVGFYAFGIAFVMPHMTTAALMPFPRIAGTAAAMLGFVQMGSGVLGGTIAATMGEPVLSLHFLMPGMGALCGLFYLWHIRAIRRFMTSQSAQS